MTDTPDNSEALEAAVTDLLVVTGQLIRRLRAVSNEQELTWSQVAIMSRLDRTGPMTTAELARAESVKPQSMGATLASLEETGLIERRPHPSDGRQVLLALTEDGLATRRRVGFAKREWLVAAMAKLGPEEHRTLVSAVELLRRLGASS